MKILYATSEAAPYFKSGGLGDVSRSLPDALSAAGHDVHLMLPLYGTIRDPHRLAETTEETRVPWLSGSVPARFHTHRPASARAPAVFVDQPAFFGHGSPYVGNGADPFDAGRRFAFFCRAVVHYAHAWQPDVIHLNDWTTGLVPLWGHLDGLRTPTVFAIHNLAYQGLFPQALLRQVGIPEAFYRTENGVEFNGMVSFLKAGLALADRLVTVSPTYAREIQTPVYGSGFDGLLRFRQRVLDGILNGIDLDLWNPAADEHIAARYSAATLDAKELNRTALVEASGIDGNGPIFGMVTRLVGQKGIDLVLGAIPGLLASGARLVVLGDGERRYEDAISGAARAYPSRIAAAVRFDDGLARQIYAGADFFLMPSRYEPCGLGQMIAQRYGTPPVARHTGGLVDTITHGQTGSVFDDAAPHAVVGSVAEASSVWRSSSWDALRRRCMKLDWSWARSAALYESVYRLAAGRPTG